MQTITVSGSRDDVRLISRLVNAAKTVLPGLLLGLALYEIGAAYLVAGTLLGVLGMALVGRIDSIDAGQGGNLETAGWKDCFDGGTFRRQATKPNRNTRAIVQDGGSFGSTKNACFP